MKLCDKLYTDTSSYVIIYTRTRPCKSKICVETRLFLQLTSRSQSSHEECGPSVGQLTPRPPDPRATLRDSSELAGAVAQCVVHDTASPDRALWHTESKLMFKSEEESKHVTQQGLSRDNNLYTDTSL